jgi:Predicted redox protein, regulator of disulfide bond formation
MVNEIKKKINLHGVVCPLNFVKTKLALEELQTGEMLEIILDEGEAMLNVPRSLKEEGHVIKKVEPMGETFRVLVEKG